MFFTHIIAIAIPCAVALVAVLRLTRRRVYPLPLPPGPRPLPFLGNVLRLDTARPWITYTEWAKEYGNIIYSSLLGIDMIIINSDTVARELLNKRSAIYSDRPVIRTRELSGLDFLTAFLTYGETLQQHRKIFHQVLKAETSLSYYEVYHRQANELVISLLGSGTDLRKPMQACERYTGSVTMGMTYGHIAHADRDPVLDKAREFTEIVSRVTSPEKAALFTVFPFLGKLPTWCFSGDYALMGRSKELSEQLLNEPFNEVKARMTEGTALQSLVADFLSQTHNDAEEYVLKDVALSGYLAGTGTSALALHIFILAMVLYPDVQARARAEIDQVVKHDMMPSIDDRASLPYLDAILREVLRWYPPAPLGFAHATTEDDIYDRYFIPKGTLVMVNQWAISRDEDEFPNASHFDPSRHLTADGQLKDTQTSNHFAFGYGRRVCPGRWFAVDALWTAMVAMLSVLRIGHAIDSNGNKIEFEPEFTPGVQVCLKPFPCSFESVNGAREGQLRAMMNLE